MHLFFFERIIPSGESYSLYFECHSLAVIIRLHHGFHLLIESREINLYHYGFQLSFFYQNFLLLLLTLFIIMCFTCSSSSFCLYVYPFICENWVQRSNSAQVNFICLSRGGQFTKPCFTCKLIIKLHNSMNFANLIV